MGWRAEKTGVIALGATNENGRFTIIPAFCVAKVGLACFAVEEAGEVFFPRWRNTGNESFFPPAVDWAAILEQSLSRAGNTCGIRVVAKGQGRVLQLSRAPEL
eukprot:1488825-Rhodomonas_salina.1